MKKLTRYTSIEALKASRGQLQTKQSGLGYKSDLIEFIAVMKKHSFTPNQSRLGNPFNKSGSGK